MKGRNTGKYLQKTLLERAITKIFLTRLVYHADAGVKKGNEGERGKISGIGFPTFVNFVSFL
jgi:hypothetical protein